MNDLRNVLGADLIAALEDLVDARIAAALAKSENSVEPTWLSIEEAAAYLRVSRSTVERLLKQGRIRSTYIGRRRLLHRDDLDSVRTQSGNPDCC
jgi:excisionase family DNA binding protein